jgi:hypothetical protein
MKEGMNCTSSDTRSGVLAHTIRSESCLFTDVDDHIQKTTTKLVSSSQT